MATHLLVWNPDRWSWSDLPDLLHGFMHGRPVTARWSAGSNRRIRARDRFFLLRLNRFPTGIFASGRIMRGSHEAPDLVAQDSGRGGGLYAEVRFDMLTDPDVAMPLTRRDLAHGVLGKYRWEEGTSGRTLPEPVAAELEAAWADHFGLAVARQPTPDAPRPEQTPARPVPTTAESAATRDQNRMFDALFEHYLTMLEAGVRGEVLGQARHFTALMNAFGALSEAVIRAYFAEISAVLLHCGLPFLDAYPPVARATRALRRRLVQFLDRERARLARVWLGEAAVRRVRVPEEIVDLQGVWAPPPLNNDFRVEAYLAGRAHFPTFGGFQRREERFTALREAGCRFALAFERARLKQAQCDALARQVRLLGRGAGDDEGCDIQSFETSGEKRYIRVAATQYSRRFPVLVDPRALVAGYRRGEHFYLYRVFHFCWDPKLYMVQGDLRECLQFLPRERKEPGAGVSG
ncbi:MAG TPA: DUF3883 domain-containing protein [Gammaproteobacteria bacterium]|nr:DUF3883 domain-containing protein [Gammaproteobacteria bacterium]